MMHSLCQSGLVQGKKTSCYRGHDWSKQAVCGQEKFLMTASHFEIVKEFVILLQKYHCGRNTKGFIVVKNVSIVLSVE